MDPLQLLNMNAWEAFFDKNPNSDDWLAMYYTSESLQKLQALISSKRSVALFPKVLKIMDSCLKADKESRFTGSELLSLRQVCKTWKDAVDDLLQSDPMRTNIYDGDIARDLDAEPFFEDNVPRCIIRVESSEKAEVFTKLFLNPGHSGHNGFPSRHLVVDCSEKTGEDALRFRAAVSKLLELSGHHIWFFSFISEWRADPVSLCSTLSYWLRLIPNVKMITLRYQFPRLGLVNQDEPDQVNDDILFNKIPCLPYLTTLWIEDVPNNFVKMMLTRNPQLQKLQVGSRLDTRHRCKRFQAVPYIGPKELVMNLFCSKEEFRSLCDVKWPLEKLTYTSHPYNFGWKRESDFLNSFRNTLKSLSLSVGFSSNWNLKLDLPLLQELKVYFLSSGVLTLDFILSCQALERLKVAGSRPPMNQEERRPASKTIGITRVIQFHEYQHRMYDSNIWELLPKLQTVCVETDWGMEESMRTYKREVYSHRKNGRLNNRIKNMFSLWCHDVIWALLNILPCWMTGDPSLGFLGVLIPIFMASGLFTLTFGTLFLKLLKFK